MNYVFPRIVHIDDVLPHVAGHEEIAVAEREFGTVINYIVSMPETFKMADPQDIGGAIRREARGLIFAPDGRLISRPYHKFFNIGEKEETQPHLIDLSQPHKVLNKLDGSMVRPLIINDRIAFATRMGLSDQANQATEWFYGDAYDSDLDDWIRAQISYGQTPIFEWISPENRIVIHYEHPQLVLTALRDNLSGRYAWHPCPSRPDWLNMVEEYGSIDRSLEHYISAVRNDPIREGDVIRFQNGHMVKAKADLYVQMHSAADAVRFEHKVAEMAFNGELDDLYPVLSDVEHARVKTIERTFWELYHAKYQWLDDLRFVVVMKFQDKRDFAINGRSNLNPLDVSFVFKCFDGKNLAEEFRQYVGSQFGSGPKYNELVAWFSNT